jgi:hypothetical protein
MAVSRSQIFGISAEQSGDEYRISRSNLFQFKRSEVYSSTLKNILDKKGTNSQV